MGDKPVLIEATKVDRGIVSITVNKEFLYRLSQAAHDKLVEYTPYCEMGSEPCPDCYHDRTVYADWFNVVDGLTKAIATANGGDK